MSINRRTFNRGVQQVYRIGQRSGQLRQALKVNDNITAGNFTNNISLGTTIDADNSVVIISWYGASNDYAADEAIKFQLTNTTLNCTRARDVVNSNDFEVNIWEFEPGAILSRQEIEFSLTTGTTATQTISSVDSLSAKTQFITLGQTTDNSVASVNNNLFMYEYSFNSDTQAQLTRTNKTDANTEVYRVQVIEWI